MARGGSAGGLLMGAVANLAPDLFRAMVAEVPFVDCLTTILDETLPLTVLEWEEWGNPVEDPEIYQVMKSYSPYDNVRSVDAEGRPVRYPDILATAGLSDPRVGFWEPAKWVAKLRAANPDNRVLLKTELGAGHGGPSGRYDAWKDEAFVYSFILDALGLAGELPDQWTRDRLAGSGSRDRPADGRSCGRVGPGGQPTGAVVEVEVTTVVEVTGVVVVGDRHRARRGRLERGDERGVHRVGEDHGDVVQSQLARGCAQLHRDRPGPGNRLGPAGLERSGPQGGAGRRRGDQHPAGRRGCRDGQGVGPAGGTG